MKKRVFILLIALAITLALTACGGGNTPSSTPTAQASDPPVQNSDPEPDTTPEPDPDPTPEPKAEEQPFVGVSNGSTMVGTFTINCEWIPFVEPLKLKGWNQARLAVTDDTFFVLAPDLLLENGEKEEVLTQYLLEDNGLVYVDNLPSANQVFITTDDNGVLYASSVYSDLVGFKDGQQIFAYDWLNTKCPVHPSGEWGLAWHATTDKITKFTFNDGILEKEDWGFAEAQLEYFSGMSISQNYIFLSGKSLETGNHTVFVYDLDGNLKYALGENNPFGDEASLASINAVVKTQNGLMAVDGNYRNLCFYNLEGQFIGKIAVSQFLGTDYPWMTSAQVMPDSSIIIGMTQERDDESCYEFVVYRLTGF